MKIKSIFALIPIFIFILSSTQVNAQRKKRGTKSRTSSRTQVKEPTSFTDKLNYEIKLGNVNLSNNIFGIALKPGVGYKVHEKITAGLGTKLGYEYFNHNGPGQKGYLDYGFFTFIRGKLIKNIYLQAEYGWQSFDNINDRQNFAYPALGGGYLQSGKKWSYGAEVLFNINENIRTRSGVVEYWINFSYNF